VGAFAAVLPMTEAVVADGRLSAVAAAAGGAADALAELWDDLEGLRPGSPPPVRH
jgi:hypothetical protein